MQKLPTVFERDLKVALDRFPKLRLMQSNTNYWVVSGELDICDTKGNYWNTFEIQMLFSKNYPFCIPVVTEVSKIIPREIDWHISLSGDCCLDIPHKLVYQSRLGVNISDFVATKVYPYFSNQLYKLQTGSYAGSEFAHHREGIIQFYTEELRFEPNKALYVLQRLTRGKSFNRNEMCYCGKKVKLKNCHISTIEFLKSMPHKQLSIDLKCFKLLKIDA